MVGILSGLGDFIKERPDQFAIAADTIGKNLDPSNIFAGIGTAFGQSSIASKALAEEKAEKLNMRKLIADLISGKQQLTPAGIPGVTGANIKPGKEDGTSELSLSITEPGDVTAGVEGDINPVAALPDPRPKQNLGDLISSPF